MQRLLSPRNTKFLPINLFRLLMVSGLVWTAFLAETTPLRVVAVLFLVFSAAWIFVSGWVLDEGNDGGLLPLLPTFLDISALTVLVYYTGTVASMGVIGLLYAVAICALNTKAPQGLFALVYSNIAFMGSALLVYGKLLPAVDVLGGSGEVRGASLILAMLLYGMISTALYLFVRRLTLLLEAKNRELFQLSRTDALTALANRRHFEERLDEELRRHSRRGGALSLILFDIDYFKLYNDSLGHPAGDACLRAVARVAAENFERAGELVARVGGEEFAILLPDTDGEEAGRQAERLRRALSKRELAHPASEIAGHVTLSAGVSTFQNDFGREVGPPDEQALKLWSLADQALYQAKQAGRDRVVAAGSRPAGRPASPRPPGQFSIRF